MLVKFLYFILVVSMVYHISCQKKFLCPDCDSNKPPIAKAGSDQKITLPKDSTVLDGSASSDPDGSVASYKWTKISGPPSSNIVNPNSPVTIVKSMVLGVYQFELTVTDNGGLSAKDTVQVMLDNPLVNQPPVACAGADQTIILPINTADLDGSCSTDPENNIATYSWSKIAGPALFTISNPGISKTKVSNLIEGVYGFELKVTDAGGLFSIDTITIVVQNDCKPVSRANVSVKLVPFGTLSLARQWINITGAGNKLLFVGGRISPGGPPVSRVDIYDFATSTWSIAELSQEREEMAIAVLGTKVFFAGGFPKGGGFTSRVDIYDAALNTWSIAQLSIARRHSAAGVIGNKVLFAGGSGFGAASSNVDIFDQSTNSWSVIQLSEGRDNMTATTVGDKIYFAGGYELLPGSSYEYRLSTKIHIYDNTTATWSLSSLTTPKVSAQSIFEAGEIYWAGGTVGHDYRNDSEIYTCQVEVKDVNAQATTFHNLSYPKSLYGLPQNAFVIGTKIYFPWQDKIDIYDVVSNSWSIGVLPPNMTISETFRINNTIYVVGYANGQQFSNQVYKLEF